ncbi:MAG: DUF2585 family protein [Promethearchaeota archaeon]
MGKIIATKKSEVSQSFLDYFTFGHLIFGMISFFIGHLFFDIALSLWITSLAATAWELIENNFKIFRRIRGKMGRPEKDSLLNSISDIIFTNVGGLLAFLFPKEFLAILINLIIVYLVSWLVQIQKDD